MYYNKLSLTLGRALKYKLVSNVWYLVIRHTFSHEYWVHDKNYGGMFLCIIISNKGHWATFKGCSEKKSFVLHIYTNIIISISNESDHYEQSNNLDQNIDWHTNQRMYAAQSLCPLKPVLGWMTEMVFWVEVSFCLSVAWETWEAWYKCTTGNDSLSTCFCTILSHMCLN